MDARTRILTIRLMELLRKDPAYAKTLGIEAGMNERLTGSIQAYLRAEGLTEL